METLFDGEGEHYTIVVLAVIIKVAAIKTLHFDGFLQQFHLVIRYKNRIYNKVVDMLSRPIVNSSIILKHNFVLHESYIEQYAYDNEFRDVYASLSQGNKI